MDSERFDRLVRSFGQTRSRRQIVRGLAGAAAAGALALSGREASADVCKGDGKKCTKDGQCCSGSCVNPSGKPVAKSGGTCQTATPHVCSGQVSLSPCFPFSASSCGTNSIYGPCRCGTDLAGNLTCYANTYCNFVGQQQCTSNADCEAMLGQPGSVCFSAGDCCGANTTGCATPCPSPSA